MNTSALTAGNYQPFDTAPARPRLLIVSESADRSGELRAVLDSAEVEIIEAHSIEEADRAYDGGPELVFIDVCAADIVTLLRTLRARGEWEGTSILVDVSRLHVEPRLAGVFPQYRAMPCSQADLVRLVRHRIRPETGTRKSR